MRRRLRVRECSRISNPTRHFFKIIVKASLERGELMIPIEFTRQYTKKIADVAVLKVPTGRKWEVEVKKEDESVRFQNGWREFLEYYSISVGDFLVFRYDGNSTFCVFIFNQGACEIDYPSDTDDDLHMIPLKEEQEKVDSEEPLWPLPSSQPVASSTDEVDKDQELPVTKRRRGRPRKINFAEKQRRNIEDHSEYLIPVKEEREEEDPVDSLWPLPSSTAEYLGKAEELLITKRGRGRPRKSSVQNLRTKKHHSECLIPIKEEPEEEHPVETLGGFPSVQTLPYSEEVVTDKAQELQVTKKKRGRPRGSFSARKLARNKKHQQLRELGSGSGLNGVEGKGRSLDAENDMEVMEVSSDNPKNETRKFKATETPSFSMGSNAQHQNTDADNSLTYVSLFACEDASLQFKGSEPSAAATREVETNCLEQESKARNHTSATEFDAGKHLDSKHEQNANMPSSHSYKRVVAASKRSLMYQQREKAKYAAQMYKTKNPSVMIIMTPSYVHKGMALNFPRSFASKYLNYGLHSVKVSVSDGRTWLLRCSINERKAMISGGWSKFVRDTKLKDGDCCVFELSKAKGMELKISIFRVVEEA